MLTVYISRPNNNPVAVNDIGRVDLGRLNDRADRGFTFDENGVLTVTDGAEGTTENRNGIRTTYNRDLLFSDDDTRRPNDRDPDGTTLTIIEVGGAKTGVGTGVKGSTGGLFTIDANGAWKFDPGKDFANVPNDQHRTTSVVYTISDGGLSDTATLTVRVTGINDAPGAPVGNNGLIRSTRPWT